MAGRSIRIRNVSELLNRARSAIGRKVKYKLGSGGRFPQNDTPAGSDGACDCSGFVCWCLGISRYVKEVEFLDAKGVKCYVHYNGGWINTDAMIEDGTKWRVLFEETNEPRLGDLIVYGSSGGDVGHVGIVSEVKDGKVTKVIHCSAGNYRRYGDAIQETPPTVFRGKKVYFLRFKHFVRNG